MDKPFTHASQTEIDAVISKMPGFCSPAVLAVMRKQIDDNDNILRHMREGYDICGTKGINCESNEIGQADGNRSNPQDPQ